MNGSSLTCFLLYLSAAGRGQGNCAGKSCTVPSRFLAGRGVLAPPSKVLPLDYYGKTRAWLLRLTVAGRYIVSRFYRYPYAGRPAAGKVRSGIKEKTVLTVPT